MNSEKTVEIDEKNRKVIITFPLYKNYRKNDFCNDYTFDRYRRDVTQFLEFSSEFVVLKNDKKEIKYTVPYYGKNLLTFENITFLIPELVYTLFVERYILKWDHGDLALRNICYDGEKIRIIDFNEYSRFSKNLSGLDIKTQDLKHDDVWIFSLYNDLTLDDRELFFQILNFMRKNIF